MRSTVAGFLFAASLLAQDVVSVRAGFVHHVEGEVDIDGKRVEAVKPEKLFSQPHRMKDGSVLTARDGRAEILLSPGVALRVANNSSIRLLAGALTDTQVELVNGSALLEVMGKVKENVVTLSYRDSRVVPRREGLYRLGGDIPELMVYDGKADLTQAGQTRTLGRGRAVVLGNWKMSRKFDPRKGDVLVQWSIQRSEQMALASRATTGSLLDQRRGWSSAWQWNPYYGMWSFIPGSGQYCGYFGYCFYSPQAFYVAFVAPPPQTPSSMGEQGGGPTYGRDSSGGYSTVSQRTYEPAVAPSSPAASAPAPARTSESSAGRGGEGGGRSQ